MTIPQSINENSTVITDYPVFDIHFHADARSRGGGELPKLISWMKQHNISRCIVPQYELSMPRSTNEELILLDNFKSFKDQLFRLDVILTTEHIDREHATDAVYRMKESGAIGFGEHYGRGLYFDDPISMNLYHACETVGLPLLYHMDRENNMDDENLSHLENALSSFPNCQFIAHGPKTWKLMTVLDTLLSKYPNLHADISAGSGAKGLSRDLEYSRDFITRHCSQVLFGTDGGHWSYEKPAPPQFQLMNQFCLPKELVHKICWKNACSLFGISDTLLNRG